MSLSNNFPTISPSLLLDFANTKRLDPRVTFTRSTTAVYYDGVTTAKAEENLLLYSQDFDNAYWTKNSTTITANSIAAPDGTTTADTLSAAGTGLNAILRSIAHTAEQLTFSIYAKAGTKSILQIDSAALGPGAGRANFNLASGTLGTVDSAWTASIVSAGNGWYRCIATFTGNGVTGNFILSMQDSATAAREANSTAGDIYLWGAQWEQRSSVTAYTPTTTAAITNYIPQLLTAAANVPRFDCNPTTGESLGLLIEEQRTNLLTYSAQFDDASYLKENGATIGANVVIAPDGTLSGDQIIEGTVTNRPRIRTPATTATNGTAYSMTIYAKAAGRNFLTLDMLNGTAVTQFNLATGQVAQTTSGTNSITPVGNNWYRLSVSGTFTQATGGYRSDLYVNDVAGSGTYTGNGFSGVFIWGAQIEAGAFPTSYMATTASTFTRNADAASMTGTAFSSWFNANQGTLYTEGGGLNAASSARLASITDNTFSNRIINYFATSGLAAGLITTSGVSQANPVVSITSATALNKVIQGYALNNVNIAANGTLGTLDTSATIPAVTLMRIGVDEVGTGSFLNGTIRKIAYYPVRLTDAQLQALTL